MPRVHVHHHISAWLATFFSQSVSAPSVCFAQEMLASSRAEHSGLRLEVNERILDSCTALTKAIQVLILKSKTLQREIVEQGRVRDCYESKICNSQKKGIFSHLFFLRLPKKFYINSPTSIARKYLCTPSCTCWCTHSNCQNMLYSFSNAGDSGISLLISVENASTTSYGHKKQ